jgi:hypothetical protein
MTSKLYESFLKKNPSPQERFNLGKSIRKEVERSSIGQFTEVSKRQGPIEILLAQAKTRIPEYVPIRHARMADNPFAFFRGGAATMAHDLANLPSPSIPVQLCGDMHVSNFGFFSTTEHQLVFGINDFDETLPGNFDWDLKRLAASAMIAAQLLGQDQAYGEDIVRNISRAYRNNLHRYASMPYIDLKRTYIDEKSLTHIAAKKAAARRGGSGSETLGQRRWARLLRTVPRSGSRRRSQRPGPTSSMSCCGWAAADRLQRMATSRRTRLCPACDIRCIRFFSINGSSGVAVCFLPHRRSLGSVPSAAQFSNPLQGAGSGRPEPAVAGYQVLAGTTSSPSMPTAAARSAGR